MQIKYALLRKFTMITAIVVLVSCGGGGGGDEIVEDAAVNDPGASSGLWQTARKHIPDTSADFPSVRLYLNINQ